MREGLRRIGPNGPDDAEPVVTEPAVRAGGVPLRRPEVLGHRSGTCPRGRRGADPGRSRPDVAVGRRSAYAAVDRSTTRRRCRARRTGRTGWGAATRPASTARRSCPPTSRTGTGRRRSCRRTAASSCRPGRRTPTRPPSAGGSRSAAASPPAGPGPGRGRSSVRPAGTPSRSGDALGLAQPAAVPGGVVPRDVVDRAVRRRRSRRRRTVVRERTCWNWPTVTSWVPIAYEWGIRRGPPVLVAVPPPSSAASRSGTRPGRGPGRACGRSATPTTRPGCAGQPAGQSPRTRAVWPSRRNSHSAAEWTAADSSCRNSLRQFRLKPAPVVRRELTARSIAVGRQEDGLTGQVVGRRLAERPEGVELDQRRQQVDQGRPQVGVLALARARRGRRSGRPSRNRAMAAFARRRVRVRTSLAAGAGSARTDLERRRRPVRVRLDGREQDRKLALARLQEHGRPAGRARRPRSRPGCRRPASAGPRGRRRR